MAKKKYPNVRERDGRFTYRYSVDVIDPISKVKKRKQKETESFPTAKAAYEAGILITSKQLQGQLVDEKNINLEDWSIRWIDEYALERQVKPSTLRLRKYGLDVLKRYLGVNTLVRDVSKPMYQRILNKMKQDGLGKNTILTVHGASKLLFYDAVRKEIISDNPTDNSVIPAFHQTIISSNELEKLDNLDEFEIPQYMEKEELKVFLQIARFMFNPMVYAAYLVLSYTGLRLGELRALQWSDFDRDKGILNINKTLFTMGNVHNYVFQTPKTKWSRRKVTIGDTVVKALSVLETWQKELKLERGNSYFQEANFIFISDKFPGYPISDGLIRSYMKQALVSAGLPTSLSPHSLRHTHVSLLAESPKVKLEDIQQRLGHRNGSAVTLIYLHITKKRQNEMPDHFETVMRA